MRISDWSSDVCSSDLGDGGAAVDHGEDGGDAAAQGRLVLVDQAAQFLGVQAFDDLADEVHRANLFGAGGLGGAAAAERQRLLRFGQFAFQLAALFDQGGDAGGHFLRRRDRKSGGEGKSVSVRVDLGGRRIIKKNKQQ